MKKLINHFKEKRNRKIRERIVISFIESRQMLNNYTLEEAYHFIIHGSEPQK